MEIPHDDTLAEDFLNDMMSEETDEDQSQPTLTTAPRLVTEALNVNKYDEIIKEISQYREQPRDLSTLVGRFEDDAEYSLLVKIPQFLIDLTSDIDTIHSHLKDLYSKYFPELETLVPTAVDYAKTIKAIGTTSDITKINLSSILPPPIIMGIVTAWTSRSIHPNKILISTEQPQHPNTSESIDEPSIFSESNILLSLHEIATSLVEYLTSRIELLAPSLTTLVGGATAAQLISAAGGLSSLARLPSNVVQILGQKKVSLHGFSAAQNKPRCGYIYDTELIQSIPPDDRKKAVRYLAGKAALAARADSVGGGDIGKTLREDVERRFNVLLTPPPQRKVKVIVPNDQRKKGHRRGGRRVRRVREMYEMTEMRKNINKMKFLEQEEEVNGRGFGELRSKKLRVENRRILKKKDLKDGKTTTLGGMRTGVATMIGNGSTTSVNINHGGIEIYDPLGMKK